ALMPRPRTPIGTFGAIGYRKLPGGNIQARVRVRDEDGQLRRVEAVGTSRLKAETTLKEKLAVRSSQVRGNGELTPDTPFPKLVEV
ncbi:MAG: hypothetical protein QM655_00970, partial [Nocardioidaceae bacterium]